MAPPAAAEYFDVACAALLQQVMHIFEKLDIAIRN
jgi:hypothetical protein